MAGTLRGSIEHYINSAMQIPHMRDQFASIVRFFDAHPQMVRIASYAGTGFVGSASLALPGYSTDANYTGRCAFGVWRWTKVNGDKIYILLQWADWSSGFTHGLPAVARSNYGVCITFAMDSSGGDCWNGGVANAGADAKGGRFSGSAGVGPVWVANGGTLLAWPRANGSGGTYATNRQALVNITNFYQGSQVPSRVHVLSDDDHLMFVVAIGADGSYAGRTIFGSYVHRAGLAAGVGDYALYSNIDWTSATLLNTDIGTTTLASDQEGGLVAGGFANGIRTFRISLPRYIWEDALLQPNARVGKFDLFDVMLYQYEAPYYGFVGGFDPAFLSFAAGVSSDTPNSALSKLVVGATTRSPLKFVIPWDGTTVPRTISAQTGVQFP